MKILRTIFAVFILILLTGTAVFAQSSAGLASESRGGSFYSSPGVGYPMDVTSAGLNAQGLLGVTNVSRSTSGLANPALWGDSYYTLGSTGFVFSRWQVEDRNSSNVKSNLETGYLHLLLPVSKGKFGLSLALYPSTRSNVRANNPGMISGGSVDSTVTYNNEIVNIGGVNKFEIGLGWKINRNFAVGYAPSIAFLILENSETFTFSGGGFNTHSHTSRLSGATIAHRFGITGTFSSVLREADRLSFGATANLPFTITADRSFTSEKNVEGRAQVVEITGELDTKEGDITVPLDVAFGLGYAPSRIVNFAAEAQLQQWSNYEDNLQSLGDVTMQDRLKLGLGGQYHPYRVNSNSFFSRFKYSAGVSYDAGHLAIEGQDIQTFWLNTGIGIASRQASFIDVSLQYGLRGTTTNNLIREQVWSVSFSINLTEEMFVRPKLR